MRSNYFLRRLAYAGLLFDVAWFYPSVVHARIRENRKRRAGSVDAAMLSDIESIAGDMRRTLDKWDTAHG